MSYSDQKQLGGKGFISAYRVSQREIRAEGKVRNPESGTDAQAMKEH